MKLAYVVPRYGADIHGGAEQAARQLAERMATRPGYEVEVLTTTATDMVTWADDALSGTTHEAGVTVHRFPVTGGRLSSFDQMSASLLAQPDAATPTSEARWIDSQGPVSPDLIEAVAATDADLVIFYPYLYHPTLVGLPLVRGRGVLHPAAHEEPPLHLPAVGRLVDAAAGLVFQTDAERHILESAHPRARLRPQLQLGLGVEGRTGDRQAARDGVGPTPFLLCLGRVEPGKGSTALARFMAEYLSRRETDLQLVFAGPVLEAPPVGPGIRVLGPVDEEVKWGLIREARALVSPSAMESNSLVVLEGLLAGRPVVVNARCAATTEHARMSGAGLWFDGYGSFEAIIDRLAEADAAEALGAGGPAYVNGRYGWPELMDRYATFLEGLASRLART
ncbi:MAG: glycosyltransferase family 4 protein [Actinomycetia bacterium]|nr:glycosyltransferase family 4 protein [Actinomycetes bacterium]